MSMWDKVIEKAKDIDAWRKFHMSFAEWVDAWRVIPRLIVLAYGYMTWVIVQWYMNLEPHFIEGCNVTILKEACIVQSPSTEHMALVTAVLAVAAAVIGLYTGSGKKWDTFIPWNKTNVQGGVIRRERKTDEYDGE